jgi:hypothetical protein
LHLDRHEILWQPIPLPENSDFEMTIDYRTSGIPKTSGLIWRVADAFTGAVLADMPDLYSEEGERRTLHFRTGAHSGLARLSLWYEHDPETPRIEGYLTIRGVELRRAKAAS